VVGCIALAVVEYLSSGNLGAARSMLEERLDAAKRDPNGPPYIPFLHALLAIADGSRDRSLAEATDLHYTMAAELELLLDALDATGTERYPPV
jgi:hypothetical protein